MYYVVTYDIPDDGRRNRVSKILQDFGTRCQYSVFECDTDRRAYLRLQDRIEQAIDLKEDSVIFYHLCRTCEKGLQRFGVKKSLDKKSYIV